MAQCSLRVGKDLLGGRVGERDLPDGALFDPGQLILGPLVFGEDLVFGRLVVGQGRERIKVKDQDVGGACFLGAEIGLVLCQIGGEVRLGRRRDLG